MSDQDSRLSLIADSVIGACVGVIIGCAFLMLQLVQLRPSNINIGAPVVNFDPGCSYPCFCGRRMALRARLS